MIYRITFWAPYRGTVRVKASSDYGPNLALHVVLMALRMFNDQWPGMTKKELHVTGIEENP